MNAKGIKTLEAVNDLLSDALIDALRAKELLRALEALGQLEESHRMLTAEGKRREAGLYWHASQAALYLDRARADIAEVVAELADDLEELAS